MRWNWDFIRGRKTDFPKAMLGPNGGVSADVKMIMVNGHGHPMQEAHLSDMEVAGQIRMLERGQLDHERVCTLARDRIVYLADRLGEDKTKALFKASQILALIMGKPAPAITDEANCASECRRAQCHGRCPDGPWCKQGKIPASDAEVTVGAAAVVDIWMGGDASWRWRINDSDFLESTDWLKAIELSRAVLSSRGGSHEA